MQKSDKSRSPLAIERQGSFFVGGAERYAQALHGGTATFPGTQAGHITTGQMYVQYQIPVDARHVPVVMVHGGGLSGQSYETTPDGRMGWNEYFLRSGRPVYVVDQVGRGRSGFDATRYNAVKLGALPPNDQGSAFMFSHEYAWEWFRIGPKVGTPFADTQFPLENIDAFYKMWIPDLSDPLEQRNPTYGALATLSRQIGGAVLMGHSQSCMFPQRAALLDPSAVKGIISLESSRTAATSFSQQELATLAKIPMLIVFADHLADAPEPFGSRWIIAMKQYREFADAVRGQGGDVTFLHLPERGIHGNTHMFMLDKNSLQIADLLLDWIDRHVQHPAK